MNIVDQVKDLYASSTMEMKAEVESGGSINPQTSCTEDRLETEFICLPSLPQIPSDRRTLPFKTDTRSRYLPRDRLCPRCKRPAPLSRICGEGRRSR